jgi:hypothetical protein
MKVSIMSTANTTAQPPHTPSGRSLVSSYTWLIILEKHLSSSRLNFLMLGSDVTIDLVNAINAYFMPSDTFGQSNTISRATLVATWHSCRQMTTVWEARSD